MTSLSKASDAEIDAADAKIRYLVKEFSEMVRDEFEDGYSQPQAMTLTAIVLTELVTRWIPVDNNGKVTTGALNKWCKGIRTCASHYTSNPATKE